MSSLPSHNLMLRKMLKEPKLYTSIQLCPEEPIQEHKNCCQILIQLGLFHLSIQWACNILSFTVKNKTIITSVHKEYNYMFVIVSKLPVCLMDICCCKPACLLKDMNAMNQSQTHPHTVATTHCSFVQHFNGARFCHIVLAKGLFQLLKWRALPLPKHHQVNVTGGKNKHVTILASKTHKALKSTVSFKNNFQGFTLLEGIVLC